MVNLDDFKNYLKIHVDSKHSQEIYLSVARSFFSCCKDFNQDNVNAYLALRIEKNSKSTFNVTLAGLRHYGKHSKIEIDFPKYKNEGRKLKEHLTEQELYEIISYFPRIFQRADFVTFIFKILFYTGIRPSELVNLKVNDINLKENYFLIKNPKDKDDRRAPFPKQLKSDIEKYLQTEGRAFKISYVGIKHYCKTINEMLNFKKLTPYILRRSFAHFCLDMGIPVEKLQLLMGHSKIETTMIYAQPKEKDAIDTYNNLIKITTKFKK